MTDTGQIYTSIRRIRKYAASLTGILIILLGVLPVLLFVGFIGWRSYEPAWDEVLWQSSLQNGSFWLLPGHVIFQDDTQLGGEDEVAAATIIMFLIFLAPVALGSALIYRLFAFATKAIIFRRGSATTKKLVLAKDTLLWQLLPDLRDEKALECDDFLVAFTGRSLVIQTPVSTASIPPLFFDSVSNDIARREGQRLIFNREDELVLDGTTFEHFRIYSHVDYHAQLVYFLTSDVLAIIVKELDKAEIILEQGTLTAIVDVRSIKTEKDLQILLDSTNRLRKLFDSRALKGGKLSPRLASINSTIRFLGLAVIKTFWVQVMMWLVVGLYVSTAMAANGRAMTGDMLLPVWLAGSFQLIGIHRTLKHRISLTSGKGIFTSDWMHKFRGWV